jgi:hypothetical protein
MNAATRRGKLKPRFGEIGEQANLDAEEGTTFPAPPPTVADLSVLQGGDGGDPASSAPALPAAARPVVAAPLTVAPEPTGEQTIDLRNVAAAPETGAAAVPGAPSESEAGVIAEPAGAPRPARIQPEAPRPAAVRSPSDQAEPGSVREEAPASSAPLPAPAESHVEDVEPAAATAVSPEPSEPQDGAEMPDLVLTDTPPMSALDSTGTELPLPTEPLTARVEPPPAPASSPRTPASAPESQAQPDPEPEPSADIVRAAQTTVAKPGRRRPAKTAAAGLNARAELAAAATHVRRHPEEWAKATIQLTPSVADRVDERMLRDAEAGARPVISHYLDVALSRLPDDADELKAWVDELAEDLLDERLIPKGTRVREVTAKKLSLLPLRLRVKVRFGLAGRAQVAAVVRLLDELDALDAGAAN